jgi:O-antigen/teichoic acid export membrane protein
MTAPATPESETGSPLRELLRHTLVYGSGYITMAVASFLLVPVYTHHLSPSAYGVLGLMLVLYGVMTQVYDLGFTNSVGRFYFDRDKADPESALARMRSTALTFLVPLGGLWTAILWIGAPTWSNVLTQTPEHANLVRIVAVTLYAEALAIVPLTLIRMQERSQLFVRITLVRFLVTIALSYVLVVPLDKGVEGALLANAASAIGVLLVLLPEYRFGFRARPSRPLLREMLGFALPFFPVLLSQWFIDASDRYLLGAYRTHAEVGYYMLGYKVAQVMQIGVAAFSMGWAPLRFKIFETPGAQQTYRRLTSYYVIAASLLVVTISVFARQVVAIVAPPDFSSAAEIVPLIACAYMINGLYILTITGMGVAKKTAPMAWVVAIAASVNIAINIVLIPKWGMHAAAATTVLANVFMAGGAWWYSEKVYPIPYDWSRIIRTILIGAVIVTVTSVFAPGTGVAGIVCGAVAVVAFAGALVATSTIHSHELASARAAVRQIIQGRMPSAAREDAAV